MSSQIDPIELFNILNKLEYTIENNVVVFSIILPSTAQYCSFDNRTYIYIENQWVVFGG